MAFYRLEVTSFVYPIEKLKRLILGKPQYGANERGIERSNKDIPRYIRITDIDEFGRLRENIGVTAEVVEEKYILENGDLLFARSGNTVGKAYLHKNSEGERCLFAGYMIRFRAKPAKVLPEYVFLCTQLRFYKHWVAATQRATGQPNINAEEYRNLEIPVPINLNAQKSLVKNYYEALAIYEKRMIKASNLLAGIDNYILGELGITLPQESKNTIANRIFIAQRKELTGWRFDPDMALYSRHTRTSKYKLSKLRDHMLFSPQYGANERGLERLNKDKPRYVRITDVNEFGELSDGLGVTAETIDYKYLLQNKDLLFARSGNTVGKTYLHTNVEGEQYIYAGYMIRFRLNPATLLPEYAFAYTLCSAYKEWCSAIQRATGQPNINAEEYKSLLIPVPPVDKQAEIAAHVFVIRNQAKQLQQQAEEELKITKRRIEAMLLGEDCA